MVAPATKTPSADERSELSLRQAVAPLFRRSRLLLLSAGLLFVLLTPVVILAFHQYRCNMAVLVNRERIDSPVSTGVPNQTVTEPMEVTPEEINSEAELLLSRDLLEKVVVATGLQNANAHLLPFLHSGEGERYRVAYAVRSLERKVKVSPSAKTNLINVSYSASDPQHAYAVVSTLARLYLDKHAAVFRPTGSYNFFAGQTERYRRALDESESRLRQFSHLPGGAAPDLLRADLDSQLASAIGRMNVTEQAIAADLHRIDSDQQQMTTTPRKTTTETSAPPDLLLQRLGSSQLAAETKKTELMLKYDSTYPLVREADQELAEANAAFAKAEATHYLAKTVATDPTYELLREDLAKSRADLAAEQASLAASKAAIANMKSQMADLAGKSLDQADLTREQKIDEENYLLYLAKREQQRTSDALDQTRIENVAIATPPSLPVLPMMTIPQAVLLSLLISVCASILLVFVADYVDPFFHTPDQVAGALNIPVIISMPKRTA